MNDRRGSWLEAGFGHVYESPLGRFKMISSGRLPDCAVFECPGCGTWAYLDDDQWRGRVSVDHAAEGCSGGYHETHDYAQALVDAIKAEASKRDATVGDDTA